MVIQALQKVFRKPVYAVLALCLSASVFAFAVWLPNIRLVADIVSSPDVPLSSKFGFPLSLLGSIATNFTLLAASYTIATALLFGVYTAMIIYFLKRRIREVGQGGIATGFLGITSGVLGVGCAACGSFLLTSLTFVGVGGIVTSLPLGGSEFGILGTILLAAAVYMTAKQIENPAVCRI